MTFEKNTELDQANLRIIVSSCAIVYISALGFLPGHQVGTYLPVILYYIVFLLASIGFRSVIAHWPGHYPARRILGMVHDYTGTSFGLVVGAEAALPLYAVMVWINLGNGMRYGSRYLAIATGLAFFEYAQAHFGVFTDAPVRPAELFEHGASGHGHGAAQCAGCDGASNQGPEQQGRICRSVLR